MKALGDRHAYAVSSARYQGNFALQAEHFKRFHIFIKLVWFSVNVNGKYRDKKSLSKNLIRILNTGLLLILYCISFKCMPVYSPKMFIFASSFQ